MTPAPWHGLAVVGLLLAAGSVTMPLRATPTAPPVDFSQHIRPLLSDRCFRCHGPDASKRKAKLRLDTREGLLTPLDDDRAVVVPGDPARSELVRRISLAVDDDDVMPPLEAHQPLTVDEQQLIERWVREGATFRDHWSWTPVASPPVPVLTAGADTPHPIDAFVRDRAQREGLTWSGPAAPGALVRRLAFSLTGLPPTASDIEAFEAAPSEQAYTRLVDRYLASPAYGERMATDWLDLARYADTYGYQADVARDMSPYRDWVISAFNRNLPYDEFLTWQLAGDLLPTPTREQRIATAFNRLHRQTNEGGSIEEEFRTEYVADRVNTFGTAMLGLTLECARCHDHKFDPITQRDYFSLFAFFNSIDESGLYSHFTNATPTPTLRLWSSHEQARHAVLTGRIAATEDALRRLMHTAPVPFESWRRQATVTPPQPIVDLPFDVTSDAETPGRGRSVSGRLHDDPVIALDAGASSGRALRFTGDNSVTLPDLRRFTRTDGFSIALRVKPAERVGRAVVLHQSQASSDAGSRGFELVLEDGRPFFGVIHFWPGDAAAVRARAPLPVDTWSALTLTYDGSSRAAGLRIHVDGREVAVDVVRDRLTRDITYDAAQGDLQTKPPPLTLGARFRDSGFRGGLIDDLQVYDRALTALEIRQVRPADASREEALAHYLARVHPASLAAAATLQRLRREENRRVRGVPELMVMEELPTPRPTHVLARGAYDAPRELVERDTPASLPPFPADQPRNRLGLARWLTSPRHPLTARVVVNRIWKMHFGRGLVATVEDFGSQGRLPTHPQLLDWLAHRFVESGWDVKALHRTILTSHTWRQTSMAAPEHRQRDPDNQWLARGPALRLPAEHIRDAALAASGLLTRQVGGRSVKPYQPDGLWEQSGTGKTYQQDHGAALYRRSLYTFWRRTSPPPSLTTFDAVSREVCVARREVTSTPLQALVLLNDPQFVEAARVLAQRLVKRFPSDHAARHAAAFVALIGRRPTAQEADVLAETYREQRTLFAADPSQAIALLQVGEAPPDAAAPTLDVAATTQVAALIMNLDAFVEVR